MWLHETTWFHAAVLNLYGYSLEYRQQIGSRSYAVENVSDGLTESFGRNSGEVLPGSRDRAGPKLAPVTKPNSCAHTEQLQGRSNYGGPCPATVVLLFQISAQGPVVALQLNKRPRTIAEVPGRSGYEFLVYARGRLV